MVKVDQLKNVKFKVLITKLLIKKKVFFLVGTHMLYKFKALQLIKKLR